MLNILATAAVAAAPMGPVDGLCLNHSRGGDNHCVLWTNNRTVHVYDGTNVISFYHVYGPVYQQTINHEDKGHVVCTPKGNDFSCILNLDFEANETQNYPLLGGACSNVHGTTRSQGTPQQY